LHYSPVFGTVAWMTCKQYPAMSRYFGFLTQALAVQPRLVLNLWSSCLSLPSAETIGVATMPGQIVSKQCLVPVITLGCNVVIFPAQHKQEVV
jgi:hypothetical protein